MATAAESMRQITSAVLNKRHLKAINEEYQRILDAMKVQAQNGCSEHTYVLHNGGNEYISEQIQKRLKEDGFGFELDMITGNGDEPDKYVIDLTW